MKKYNISKIAIGWAVATVLFSLIQTANASFIGDEIFIDRVIISGPSSPYSFCQATYGTGPEGCTVTVADGDNDKITLSGGNNHSVNVEASSILMDFGPGGGDGGPIENEHLIYFRDLDWIGDIRVITGLTFDTNLIGMDASRINFTSDSVTVKHAGIEWYGGEYLNIYLETSQVPIPAAAWLFCSGLLALIGISRRKISS
jgi:hypothetical protein